MIKVVIPNNNIEERKYIINVLFGFFDKLEYSIIINENQSDYIITYQKKSLIIKDGFFNNYPKPLSYLKITSIPSKIIMLDKNKYCNERNIPILFGNKNIDSSKDEIICSIDIFASSFYMLSRWEEIVLRDKKDKIGRFDENESLAVKFDFFRRPIVNDYFNLLKGMLNYLNIPFKFKRSYRLKVTHDVDQLYRYSGLLKYVRALVGDLVIRKNPLLLLKTTLDMIRSNISRKYDPYNNFDYLMTCSEKIGVKSHFYFIPSFLGETDARYDIRSKEVKRVIQSIFKRGHFVGIHGSWNSFNNQSVFGSELLRLRNVVSVIDEGRQHYLRFENPITWEIWNSNGLKRDSSLGYCLRNGFRCGTCYEFPVFNLLKRSRMNLIEEPLIFMENIFLLEKYSIEECISEFMELSNIVKSYDGLFVFLWHPNNFNNEWFKIANYYEKFLNIIK